MTPIKAMAEFIKVTLQISPSQAVVGSFDIGPNV